MGLSIAASIALPGIGGVLVSCLTDGTFVDMFKALTTGDWAALGMCALAFVPGGKALKGMKGLSIIGKAEKVGEKGERLFTKSSFRKNLIEMTGKNPGKSMEAHHVLPKKFEGMFKASGISNIHNSKYGAWVNTAEHGSWSRSYNDAWQSFFANGPRKSTDVLAKARELAGDYDFDVFF